MVLGLGSDSFNSNSNRAFNESIPSSSRVARLVYTPTLDHHRKLIINWAVNCLDYNFWTAFALHMTAANNCMPLLEGTADEHGNIYNIPDEEKSDAATGGVRATMGACRWWRPFKLEGAWDSLKIVSRKISLRKEEFSNIDKDIRDLVAPMWGTLTIPCKFCDLEQKSKWIS
ncbi:hypothetical protein LXL04_030458 [Taraxacum kok-saghyz]